MYPDKAYSISLNKDIAEKETVTQLGRNGLNDKSDAFRHAYFQAINTNVIGAYFTKLFSDAHESETPTQLALEKEMDLFNNKVGIDISTSSNRNATSLQIMDALLNGSLRYLDPTDANDPNFWGNNGFNNRGTATHGIMSSTSLKPTNQ